MTLTRKELDQMTQEAQTANAEKSKEAYLLNYRTDDTGNARCFCEKYGGLFVHTKTHGWLAYNGHFWDNEHGDNLLWNAITKTLLDRCTMGAFASRDDIVRCATPSKHNIANCQTVLQHTIYGSISDFDNEPDMLNCSNGVLNLRTGELIPHDSGQRFTYCLDLDYVPGASCAAWEHFLFEVIKDYDQIHDYVQMAIGYSLTGKTNEECLFYLHGATRAGKGVFTSVLLKMLGKLAKGAAFETFTAKRGGGDQGFDLAGLKQTRFVAASESSRYQQLNAAKVKALTGNDVLRCSFKRKDHFEYTPQFKIWLSSNHPVNADVNDTALWYRVKVITFGQSFANREDKHLKERLLEPANLRGAFAWAVQGAMNWYAAQNGLTTPQEVKNATDKHREKIDYVGQWFDDCIKHTGELDDFMTNKTLYQSYKEWCGDNGVTPKHNNAFGQEMSRKGYTADRVYVNEYDPITEKTTRKQKRGYKQLAFVE